MPFAAPVEPAQVLQTSTTQFGELSVQLSCRCARNLPAHRCRRGLTEPWGIDWLNPRPLEVLDVPEKVFFEIRYETGPPDLVLPLDAATGKWGMRRGLSVTVAHPDRLRKPTELVLCDRMQTASFAIVAATMLRDNPRVTEANWEHLAYPAPPAKALAGADRRRRRPPRPFAVACCRPTSIPASACDASQLSVAGLGRDD